jgi:hypothetical protein
LKGAIDLTADCVGYKLELDRSLAKGERMRWNLTHWLTVAVVCGTHLAHASPIIYGVSISDGTETVAGTITTNGTVGTLSTADITGFSLSASGPITFGPITPGSIDCFAPCGVIATPTTLTFAPIGNELDLTDFPIGRIIFSFDVEVNSFNPTLGYNIFKIPPYIIGQAQVPEPATLALLGIGLAGIGFVRRRAKLI